MQVLSPSSEAKPSTDVNFWSSSWAGELSWSIVDFLALSPGVLEQIARMCWLKCHSTTPMFPSTSVLLLNRQSPKSFGKKGLPGRLEAISDTRYVERN